MKLHFVQWTLEIASEQSFAVYEKMPRSSETRLVAGDPDKVIKVGGADSTLFGRGGRVTRIHTLFPGGAGGLTL